MHATLIIFILFVKIIFLSCIFENKNEKDLFDEINRQRKKTGLSNVEIHVTLQLAAENRCNNQEQLFKAYKAMISNNYRDDDWPKEQELNQIFSHGKKERILNKFRRIANLYYTATISGRYSSVVTLYPHCIGRFRFSI